jgi:hypothetical protein
MGQKNCKLILNCLDCQQMDRCNSYGNNWRSITKCKAQNYMSLIMTLIHSNPHFLAL